MSKTEFFEVAAQQGFYGVERGGLSGKKDNVRKYWEDISIKTAMQRPILELLHKKDKLSILDLGCGSGEGYELLTHIPPINKTMVQKEFLLSPEQIEKYVGVDVSSAMVLEGQKNYAGKENISFIQGDLSSDLSCLERGPFDIIFSSYSSPSHLHDDELAALIERVVNLHSGKFVLVLDLFAKNSIEWPCYWLPSDHEMHPYSMMWLYPENSEEAKQAEQYYVRFWNSAEINELVDSVSKKSGVALKTTTLDRSILVGRHIDTGFYNKHPQSLRYQVNRFFDRDYRGKVEFLRADISFAAEKKKDFPVEFARIEEYAKLWNMTIDFLEYLILGKSAPLSMILESAPEVLREELQMLLWLEKNSSRFPVVDFWASVIGPQAACILRNLELDLSPGLGCGHGLVCMIEPEIN